jgi:cell division transport system ATP-binding protein
MLAHFDKVGFRYQAAGAETLRDISFDIAPNSFQFLTGPSGAGKTTLLRLIQLSLKPTRGSIRIFDRDVSTLDEAERSQYRTRIGMIFQDYRLFDHLTVYENVALPFYMHHRAQEFYKNELVDLLAWVGLKDKMHTLPPFLSGGEKQRAAVARAVISRPHIVVADEPTANLDPTLARRIMRLFIELNKAGTAVLLATHDITLMDMYEARRLVLHQGRMIIYD